MEVLEAADEKKTICKYLSCGLIILVGEEGGGEGGTGLTSSHISGWSFLLLPVDASCGMMGTSL